MTPPRGLVLAAPTSGAGKTMITLGLLRALCDRGEKAAGAKCGPDYIDPMFHEAACGVPSRNLDGWAMGARELRVRFAALPADVVVVEGAMGALDGTGPQSAGAPAEVADALALPLVLVVDCARQAQSVALSVAGLRALRPELQLAGVILNRVASPRHERLIRSAIGALEVPVLGVVPRAAGLERPSRHLGLVPIREQSDVAAFVAAAGALVGAHADLDAILAAATRAASGDQEDLPRLPPLGQRIAIAADQAFCFCYPHHLDDWRAAGAELSFFSPLADEAPAELADAVFLPGGYPELHAGRLSSAERFVRGMKAAADRGTRIYGECGGYMVLGDALTDGDGATHAMLGLLPLATSFADRRLSLGHRSLVVREPANLLFASALAGHEFHYATIVHEDTATADRLFDAADGFDEPVGPMGLVRGSIMGSFAHVIGTANR